MKGLDRAGESTELPEPSEDAPAGPAAVDHWWEALETLVIVAHDGVDGGVVAQASGPALALQHDQHLLLVLPLGEFQLSFSSSATFRACAQLSNMLLPHAFITFNAFTLYCFCNMALRQIDLHCGASAGVRARARAPAHRVGREERAPLDAVDVFVIHAAQERLTPFYQICVCTYLALLIVMVPTKKGPGLN